MHDGDEVLAVDGRKLAALSVTEATLLVFGTVGATKMVQFGAAAKVAHTTVAINVNEFLPP